MQDNHTTTDNTSQHKKYSVTFRVNQRNTNLESIKDSLKLTYGRENFSCYRDKITLKSDYKFDYLLSQLKSKGWIY